MGSAKTHIYFIPGLAASSLIYENLQLPKDKFELHYIEWILPVSNKETIENYAQRMADLVVEKEAVLIGVSFGGIMVQEMSKHLNSKKIIIISSVKNRNELPKRLKVIQKTKAYVLFPTKAIANIEEFSMYAFGDFVKKRIQLYKKYLTVRDSSYLKWAIYNVLHWKQVKILKNIIHIHGVDDGVFPIKHIKNCISIEKGTHIMILNKAKSISKIITEAL